MNLNDYMAELVRTRDTMQQIRDGFEVGWMDRDWRFMEWHWPPAGYLRVRILPVLVVRKDNLDVLVRMRNALLERAVPELYREVFHDQARLEFYRKRHLRLLGRPLTKEEMQ